MNIDDTQKEYQNCLLYFDTPFVCHLFDSYEIR